MRSSYWVAPGALGGLSVVLFIAATVITGRARFFVLVGLVVGLLATVVSGGGVAAPLAHRSGRRAFAAAVGLATPVLCLIVGYAVLGLQAESVSTDTVVRNVAIGVGLILGAIALAASFDRGPQ